jgi:predicted DNA-binding transcriptional regulator AlpA
MPFSLVMPERAKRPVKPAPATSVPSSGGRRRRKPLPPVPPCLREDMLLTAKEAAAFARIGVSTFWLRVKQGDFPKPSYAVGPKSPRWRLNDLRAVLAGAAE